MKKVSVIGLGKLGACTAACLAYKGLDVIGVDVNRSAVDLLNEGRAPVVEPRLQNLITASRQWLRATESYEEAIQYSDASFLITPTPSEADGHFSIQYLMEALEHLALAFKASKKTRHLFIVTSTVSPGTIDGAVIPFLERKSGKKLGEDFSVCYNPEFIALGSVVDDFLKPDLVLIGESDRSAGDQLEELYKQVCETQPYIARMSIVSAEIAKISLNAYVTMKISFANSLASICEKIAGADIDDVTRAVGADKRVSPYYFKGGLPFGGPCFPRDNKAFAAFARRFGAEAKLAEATGQINEAQTQHITDLVLRHLSDNGRGVSVLGLAYKPNTPVIDESTGVKVLERLIERNVKVSAYDPLALEHVKKLFGDRLHYASSVRECLAESDVWVFTTPAEEFKALDDSFVSHNPTTIIDCWRVIDPEQFRTKAVRHVSVGKAGQWNS